MSLEPALLRAAATIDSGVSEGSGRPARTEGLRSD